MVALRFLLLIMNSIVDAGTPIITNFSPVSTTCVQFFLYLDTTGGPYNKNVNVVLYKSDETIVSTVLVDMSGNQVLPAAFVYPTVGSYYVKIFSTATSPELFYTSSTVSISYGSILSFISVTSSKSTPTIYEPFTLTATLTDGCGNPVSTTHTLTVTSSTTVQGTLVSTTSTSSATFSVYSTTVGANTLNITTFTTVSIAGQVSVTLSKPVLSFISFTPTPKSTLTTFTTSVGVYNTEITSLLTLYPVTSITLSSSPAGSLTGTVTASTSNGVSNYSGLRLTTTGSNIITASATSCTSGTSTLIITSPTLTSMSISSSASSPSANFDFTVTVQLFDQDRNLLTVSSSVTLTPSSLSGTKTGSTSAGSISFTIYSSTAGSLTITATSSAVTASITVTILQNMIKINSVSPVVIFTQPLYPSSTFAVSASIYDNTGNTLLTRSSFSISLALNPSGTITGTSSVSSSGGTSSFSGLKITSVGTFDIIASSTGMISGTYSSVTITALALTSIALTSSTSSISGLFSFTLTAKLYDQPGDYWTQSTVVSLTSNKVFGGSTSSTSTTGITTFSIYGIEPGSHLFTATASGISGSVSVTILSNVLSFSSISPTPSTISTSFSVSVKIYDNTGTTVASSNGPVSISLALDNTGTLSGTTTANSVSGIASFSNLMITTVGTYYLKASASYMTTITSTSSYTVIDYVLTTVTPSTSSNSYSTYIVFTVNVNLKDQYNSLWTSSSSVSISGTSLVSTNGNTGTTSTGSISFTVYSTLSGSLTITSTSGGISGTLTLSILKCSLTVTLISTPTSVNSIFSVDVQVYDNTGATAITTYGPFSITIALDPSGTLTGSLSASTSSGKASFTSLQITTYGDYKISASSNDMLTGYSSTFTILTLRSMSLSSSPSSLSAYFSFTVTVLLKDQNGGTWTSSSTVDLSGSNLFGNSGLSKTTSTGSASFQVYVTISGVVTITAISGSVTASFDLNIQKNLIGVTDVSPVPTLTNSVFSVTVKIFDPTSSNVLTGFGPFVISLELVPTGSLVGSVSENSSNGVASFASLSIITSGIYQIKATGSDLTTGYSSSLTISALALTTISVVSSTNSISAYFDFTITATLKDQSSSLWTSSTILTLSSSLSISSTSPLTTTSGTGEFTIYGIASGTHTLSVSSGGISGSTSVTILKNSLKIDSISPTPSYAHDSFTVVVKIYDNSVSTLQSRNLQFSISLSITNSGTLTGTTVLDSSSGVVSFGNLKISTSGIFDIEASCDDMVTGSSSSILILPYSLSSITVISSTSNPSCNFDFTLTVNLFDQSGSSWTSSTSVTLSSSTSIFGTLSKSIISGSDILTVYSPTPGANTLTVTSGSVSGSVQVTLVKNSLRIDILTPTPTLTNSVFSITVKIYNSDFSVVESSRGTYQVVLSLSSGTLTGTVTETSTAGSVTFNNLVITTAGNHQILASGSELYDDYSDTLVIDDLGLDRLTLSIDRVEESAYVDFKVTVYAFDQSGGSWTASISVSLTSDGSLAGSINQNIVGSGEFIVYSKSIGTLTITATSGTKSAQDSIKIKVNSLKIESILPTVRNNQPTLTTSTFTLNVCVYNNDLSNEIENYGPFTVSLSISNSGVLSGTNSGDTSSGCISFGSLSISTFGSFQITASSLNMNSDVSEYLTIKELSISITSSKSSPTCFFDFLLTVQVKDQSSSLYTNSITISLSSTDSVLSSTTITTSSGKGSITIYFTQSGPKTISASTQGYSNSKSLTSQKAILIFSSILPSPTTTESRFSATIQVVDSSGTLESIHGPHSITLSIKSSSSLGTSMTSSGSVTFSELRLSTPGLQILTASCNDMTEAESTFTIEELVLTSIEISTSIENPSANQDFQVIFQLYDQRPVIWTDSSEVILTGDLNIDGVLNFISTSGTGSFDVYSKEPGTLTLTVTSGTVSARKTLQVLPQRLAFTIQPPLKLKRFEKFSCSVGVYDNSLTILEASHGPYSVSFSVTPACESFGSRVSTSINGVSSFQDLALGGIGKYKLLMTSDSIISVYSDLVEVGYNYEVSLIVAVPTYTPMAKYFYVFQVQVMNLTSSSPLTSTTVTLTIAPSLLLNLTTDSEGWVSFSLVFNKTGETLLDFSSDIAFQSETVEVQTSNNTDPLCVVAKSAEVCLICVENSFLVNGTCRCFQGANFFNESGICECPAGKTPSNRYCINCGNYFDPSEISSYYSEDYLSIFIEFSREVNTLLLKTCRDVLKGPEYFLNFNMTCVWLSAKLFEMKLSEYPELFYSRIEVENQRVQAMGSRCDFDIHDLFVDIYRIYSVPTPVSQISAPLVYSLSCCKQNLTFYATTISKFIIYTWEGQITPENEKISKIINETQGYYLDLPHKDLQVSLLQVKLKTQFKNLGTFAVSTVFVQVTDEKIMKVELNVGSFVKVKVNQALDIQALVIENCGANEEKYLFEWTVDSKNVDIQSFLVETRADLLKIPSFSLKTFSSYKFSVIVKDSKVSGKAETTVEVIPSDLIIRLSRSSGSVSPDMNLSISSFVTDPDDSSSEISKVWTCSEQEELCLDSTKDRLFLSQSDGNLTVSKLRKEALYRFSLKAFTSKKVAYAVVLIKVDPKTLGTIEIVSPVDKVNPDYVFNVMPRFSLTTKPEFQWKIDKSPVNQLTTGDSSFIGFRERTLQEISSFKLTVEVESESFEGAVETSVDVTVNKPPECEGTTYQMIDETWALTQTLCVDGDDQDYPLTYQFGFSDSKNKEKWVREVGFNFKAGLMIPSDASALIVRVCDSLETCKVFKNTLKSNRLLQSVTLAVIQQEAKDFQRIPNLIQVYLDSNLDNSSFLYLFSLLQDYFLKIKISSQNFDMFIDCLESFFQSENKKVNIYNNLTDFTGDVLKKLEKRLSDSKVLEVLEIFEEVLEFIEISSFLKMLNQLSEVWTRDLTPPAILKHDGKISCFWGKLNGAYYPGALFQSETLLIEMNPDNDYSYFKMFDLVFNVVQVNRSVILSALYKTSADYDNYFLVLQEPQDAKVTPSHPIRVSIKTDKSHSSVKCYPQQKTSCKLHKVNNTHVVLDIENFGVYSIDSRSADCSLLRVPLIVAVFICLTGLITAIFIYNRDKKSRVDHGRNRRYWTLYSLTILFIPQNNLRRIMALSELVAILVILLGLIGFTYDYAHGGFGEINLKIGDFYVKELGRGVFAVVLIQVIPIFNLVIRSCLRSSNSLQVVCVLCNFIVIAVGFTFIVMTCLLMCPDDLDAWLINFAIFSFVQVIILNSLYSILPAILLRKVQTRGTKVTNISSDTFSPSKQMNISDNLEARLSTKMQNSQDRTTLFRFN